MATTLLQLARESRTTAMLLDERHAIGRERWTTAALRCFSSGGEGCDIVTGPKRYR
jgi:hypothetical protein